MKTAVVTDSTIFLTEDEKKHPDVFIISIPIVIDGKIYNEGVNIKGDDYYELLNNSKEFPTTSQPSIGEVLELFDDLKKKGYDQAISINLSSGISGYVNNLAQMVPGIEGIDIRTFDSKLTSMPMGHMVKTSLEMFTSGYSITEVLDKLAFIRDNTEAYLVVDDLNNLVRGGRLRNGAAIIGSLLRIKPVLKFDDGDIVLFEKIRTTKKALARVENIMGKQFKKTKVDLKFFIVHANNLGLAELEKREMEERFPGIKIEIGTLGAVVGTHVGEKAICFGWCGK